MSRKTRKLIWSAPLLAVLAVAAALAMFAAQTPIGAQAQDAEEMLGPPQDLKATADGRKVIELQWMAPATSPEDVTAYRVDVSDDGTVWMELVRADSGLEDTFYDHTQLMPGDTKHYRVFAVYGTKKGEGEPSETASATTDAATAPGKPTNLTLAAGSIGESTIRLTWAAPSDDGGSTITGYKIERLKDGETAWMTVKADTGTTGLTYEDTGLIVGTQYHYRVSAINKAGTGKSSDTKNLTTAAAGGVYTAITGLTTQGAVPGMTLQEANAAVELHWLAPANMPDGDPLTDYKVERSADGTTWTTIATVKPPARTYHPVGGAFSSGTTPWQYRVSATNRGGAGQASPALTVGPPDPATHGPAQSLRARSDTPLKINVSWREASGSATIPDTTTYRVDYSTDGQVWKAAATPYPTTRDDTSERYIYEDTGTTNTPLKIGEKRYYRVIAETSGVTHQVTNVVSGTAGTTNKPGKPTGLVFTGTNPDPTSPTADMIPLTWVAPTEPGGSPITGYKIERSLDAATGWMTIKADTGTTAVTYVDKKLVANTQYYYRVSAINVGRTGDPSDTAETKTLPAAALGLPTGLVALDRGTSVDLYWLAPDDAPGAPVTGYKIEVSEDDGTTWRTVVANTMSLDTMYTHTGLTALTGDATRMYRVSAISSVGVTAPSRPDTAAAGGMVNTDPMANDMAIDPVTVMAGMSSDAMDVSMYFSDADGDTLTYRAMSNMEMYATVAVDGSMLTITGVAAGEATITVYASDGMGGTDAMRTIMVTVTAANAAPMAQGMIDPVTVSADETSDPITLGDYFSDADDDTLTYNASSSDSMIAIAEIAEDDSDPGAVVSTLTITGVAAGEATITVTATDPAGESATQEIMVTVRAELMAPTNVRVNPVGSGGLIVAWDGVSGAHGYRIIAVNVNNVDETHSEFVNNPMATSGGLDGLTAGQTYNVFVASFDDADPPNYRLQTRFRQIIAE